MSQIENATSRSRGAVGPRALVPRKVEELFWEIDGLSVLDLGAGRDALHAHALRHRMPSWTVYACEFGLNFDADLHIPVRELLDLEGHFDVAYASNVLNVQTTWRGVVEVIANLHAAIHRGGSVVLNLPKNPRKAAWSHSWASKAATGQAEMADDASALYALLRGFFATVRKVGGTKTAPVLLLENKIEPTTDWDRT